MNEQRREQIQRNDRLRQQRVARNWRQQDVADKLDITVLTVQRWERGSQQPSAYYRVKLCALFGLSAQDLGLVEEIPPSISNESETPATQPEKKVALWMVPHTRNPHFIGRDELLDQLAQRFAPSTVDQPVALRRTALTQPQAIKGLGGIGKTQTAVEYAYRAREQGRYTHTFWINAANEEAILASFVSLAELLAPDFQEETDQRKLVAAVLRWLQQCQEPWLLIADNADDLALTQPYLPQTGNGSLLLTTRASAVGSFASSLAVETMGLMEATQLLLRRALRFADASDEEINEASNIAVALGFFPLALDQAGAYIEETGCSLQDYMHIYERHRHALLARRGRQATRYPDSVAATWSLSFQHVERANPAAAELLRLCAFMSPDHIPEELLIEGASHWPPALQEAALNPLSFNQVLETLLSFSLVKRFADDRLLSLHRLVQVVQIETMQPEEQRLWAERLIRAVHSVFPHNPQAVASWPQCSLYLEQVQACDLLLRQYHLQLPEAAEVLDWTGTYLRERALYSLAEPLYLHALQIWEQQVMPELVGRARNLNNLAGLFFWQDKHAEAEQFYQQALSIRMQQLGAQHLDVAESLHGLAGLYRMQGKYAQAEPLYQQALSIREQQLGTEHLDVAESVNGLAVLYEKQGRYKEAQALTQEALRIREQQLGSEHLMVAESLNDLAVLYEKLEKYVEGEPLYLRALHIWEQQLGADNPMVAYPLVGLATIYRKQGRYVEAEPLYLRALQIREQRLGKTHRNLVNPLTGLANLYREQGRYVEAEALYRRALQIGEQQLGDSHPLLANALDGLASLYSVQDKFAQAEPLYWQALHIREHNFGIDAPLTIDIRERLYAMLLAAGRTEDAAALKMHGREA